MDEEEGLVWGKRKGAGARVLGQGRLHREEHLSASENFTKSNSRPERLNVCWLPDSKTSWARRVGCQGRIWKNRLEWVSLGVPLMPSAGWHL